MGILGTPLGWVMKFMYDFIQNYGVVLVLFTVLVRLALFPLNVKQQKSSAKMAIFQPKLKKLEKQYGKDKQRYQEAMMKLYEEEGYNPMASCLPMVLQMVVLFGIIDVVYKPLKHLLSIPADLITEATKLLGTTAGSSPELKIVSIIQGTDTSLAMDVFNNVFSADQLQAIQDFNLSFLGLNLGGIPSMTWPLILVPLLSGLTSLGVTIFSMRQQKKTGVMAEGQQGMGMMKGMMYIMPVFSTWIAFSLPIGVGVYWIVGNVLSFVQSIILYTVYSPEKMKEQVEKEQANRKKKKPSRYQQAMAAARQQSGEPAKATEALPETVDDGMTAAQRIALARKRMAEKYGDEYDEK